METLPLAAASSIVVGFLYIYVGMRLRARRVSAEAQLAQSGFLLWWFALGMVSVIGGLQTFVYLYADLVPWIYQTLLMVNLTAIVAGLWGLLYFLVFLYTGNRRWLMPLNIVYFALAVGFIGLFNWIGSPESFSDDGWTIVAEPELALPEWVSFVFILALVGPQIGACIAYFRLFFTVDDATQKYRIALVSGSIFTWFFASVLAGVSGLGEEMWWQVFSRGLGFMAAVAILAAYLPPRWIRSKGIRSIKDEVAI